jgi:hypothetical protein
MVLSTVEKYFFFHFPAENSPAYLHEIFIQDLNLDSLTQTFYHPKNFILSMAHKIHLYQMIFIHEK